MTRTVVVLVVVAAQAGAALELSNGTIRAGFDTRGLTALTRTSDGIGFRFSGDAFSIQVNGATIDSNKLPSPSAAPGNKDIRYTWKTREFTIEAVYELQPGWRFVSKQLHVRSEGKRNFRVGPVAVFRVAVADPVDDEYVCSHPSPALGTLGCGAYLRVAGERGLLALVQNPFLQFHRDGGSFDITYDPAMDWTPAWGAFDSDRGLLAPYALSGRRLPAEMIPEWKVAASGGRAGMDSAEIDAYTGAVRSFIADHSPRPANVFVGWCVNDYQIDIATPEGRTEYKRIIARAVEMGAPHILFAPANSAISLRALATDDWHWENLLWLGLGEKIRKGEWNVESDPIPPSVAEMLDYARERQVTLLAYVYPVLGFLAAKHPEWIVPGSKPERTNLGIRSYQDWLIAQLVRFAQRTGIGGYSFDHTFLTYDGASPYAQWSGWRRVMDELRRRMPDLVIDGRQAYHLYGPWSWLAGTYPHPTYNDEQPESFVPFPDLHFDRVSANRLRYTAWRYRNVDFAPSELVPGFITHQTPRLDDAGELPIRIVKDARTGLDEQAALPFRVRDWDYLGWRFSLLSSIGAAGLNNVVNLIPARDMEEFRNFRASDIAEFRHWIDWTRENAEVLRHTRTIIGQPAIGKVDGTAAIAGDHGYIFLFNPNGRRLDASFDLDVSIGLTSQGRFVLSELYPLAGRRIGKPGHGYWESGDKVSIPLDGTSALVMQIEPAPVESAGTPAVFNAPGHAVLHDGILELSGVRGECGTAVDLLVDSATRPTEILVNGRAAAFEAAGPRTIRTRLRFAGAPFTRSQQVDLSSGAGGLSGRFAIPKRVFEQLAQRKRAWPIPWTANDYKTTWLAPERLLLFVQIAEPDDRMDVALKLDGREFPLEKAYSSIRVHRPSFVGFYADVSSLAPDRNHSVELRLPALAAGQFQGLFFDNVENEYTDVIER